MVFLIALMFGAFGALVALVLLGAITGNYPFKVYVLKWFKGYTLVKMVGTQYDWQDDFITAVKFDENGESVDRVWRYTGNGIGRVTIRKDGTADYCGEYKWTKIK